MFKTNHLLVVISSSFHLVNINKTTFKKLTVRKTTGKMPVCKGKAGPHIDIKNNRKIIRSADGVSRRNVHIVGFGL